MHPLLINFIRKLFFGFSFFLYLWSLFSRLHRLEKMSSFNFTKWQIFWWLGGKHHECNWHKWPAYCKMAQMLNYVLCILSQQNKWVRKLVTKCFGVQKIIFCFWETYIFNNTINFEQTSWYLQKCYTQHVSHTLAHTLNVLKACGCIHF